MARYGLSRKHQKDPRIWQTVATSFLKKWLGDPRRFVDSCDYHAPTVLARLSRDTHDQGGRLVPDYPYLRGRKIGPLWIRMLRDNVGISLSGLEEVPIPVDVHVLRATLCTSVVSGTYSGAVEPIFEVVRRVWKEATRGLDRNDGSEMIALDVDEPLWHLSKFGCSTRGNGMLAACPSRCPAAPGCVAGHLRIDGTRCELAT